MHSNIRYTIGLFISFYEKTPWSKSQLFMYRGCGSVGRAVATNARDSWFESSHRQSFILVIYLFTVNCTYWKEENKEKEARNVHFFKKVSKI